MIVFSVPDTYSIDLELEVASLTISPIPFGDGYTLAADVLAKSLILFVQEQERFAALQASQRSRCNTRTSAG